MKFSNEGRNSNKICDVSLCKFKRKCTVSNIVITSTVGQFS